VASQQREHLGTLLLDPTASPHFGCFYHAFSPRLGDADFPERLAADFPEPSGFFAWSIHAPAMADSRSVKFTPADGHLG
jgi:hypothetical protein